MGVLKKERRAGSSFLRGLRALGRLGCVVGVAGAIALFCASGCDQRTGLRPSDAGAGEGEKAVSVKVPTARFTNAHCTFCHEVQPRTIAEKGAKHRTEVGCMDCHTEHPPEGADAVPECSMCHSGEPHYDLANCATCHADTHAPLDLTLEGDISGPCLTCHQQQGDEVKKHPSAHTEVACNECHTEHRYVPNCMDCHEKHAEEMEFEACVACYPVHMPTFVAYVPDAPSTYCGACHKTAFGLLDKSKFKHHEVACTSCHPDEHRTTLPCVQCHPAPHAQGILDKFPKCGQCHGVAHDLQG